MTFGLAAAEPSSNLLLDRLMLLERGCHNDLEVKRITHEAEKLIRAGGDFVAQGYGVLGATAAYQLDPDKVRSCFKNALCYSDPDNLVTFQLNRSIALHRVYQQAEALKFVLEAIDSNRDHLQLLQEGMRLSAAALQLDRLADLRELLSRLGASAPSDLGITELEEKRFNTRRLKLGIEYSEILERIDTAGEVLLSNKVRFGSVHAYVLPNGECNYRFNAKTTPEEAAELTFLIADHLVARFENAFEDLLTIAVFPFEIDHLQEAA